MLKAVGACLVILSCTAFGYEKSIRLSKRLFLLREIRRMVLLLSGEITYRKEGLAETLLFVSDKMTDEISVFLKDIAKRVFAFDGKKFSVIFKEEVQKNFSGSSLLENDKKMLGQLGEYLGYLDIDMQQKALKLYEKELDLLIEDIQREMPQKKKLYQALGVMSGMFLAIALV